MNDFKKKDIDMQNEEQELIDRLRYWQTLSIEERLQWLESAMRFANDSRVL